MPGCVKTNFVSPLNTYLAPTPPDLVVKHFLHSGLIHTIATHSYSKYRFQKQWLPY